ncbi:MAG: NUDIX hydrolase [Spirochaetes bacterium]|nr:NUDIX hydrolase [Spirochaetota bacterium]
MDVKIIKSAKIYQGRFLSFFRDDIILKKKVKAIREYMDHPPAVGIIPFIDKDTIVMVEQYRYANDLVSLEIPAGKVNRQEELKKGALREMEEEIGYTAAMSDLIPFYTYTPAISYSREKLTLFIARNLKKTDQNPDEDEMIKVKIFKLNQIEEMIKKNKIMDSKTVMAILLYQMLKSRNLTFSGGHEREKRYES